MRAILGLVVLLACPPSVSATIRSVGPGQPYAKPCQAFAAAQDGDVVEIDAAGNYDGDVCVIYRNNLTIRGVNGRARIDAAGHFAQGKGIWVVAGDNVTVENIEFSGARVPDRNGAGIRLDSGNLTVRNCVFHDNEMGILGGFYGSVLIEHSEFYDNGYGDGQSHNIYINSGVAEFTLRYSASRRSKVGHLVKSRAAVNRILYNRLTQESGSGSYEIDLPNGGQAYVIGNIIQQGDTTQNRGMLAFGMEGLRTGTPNELCAVNNTFVSTRSAGATFVQVSSSLATPAVLRNNIFSGSGIITTQTSALMAGNVTSGEMGFLNPSQYDYRISNTSAALNAGVEPGTGGGMPLRPAMQYHHPLCAVPRSDVGAIDAGAFEYGLPDNAPVCAPGADPPPDAPDPRLASFTVGSLVTAGSSVTATIQLTAPAPQGGAVVSLASSAPQALPVPPSVTVSAGLKTASLSLNVGQVTAATTVVLTASFGGSSLQSTVTVQPPAPQLASFTAGSLVTAGDTVTATVQLAAPAPQGGAVVSLTSSAPQALPVPPSVTVSAGLKTAAISLAAGQVTAATTVVLTASLGGSSLQSTVTVQPAQTGQNPGQLDKLLPSRHLLYPGESFLLAIYLKAPAPAGGVLVNLTSSEPSVMMPPAVLIPAGTQSFQVLGTVDRLAERASVKLFASSSNEVHASIAIGARRGQPVRRGFLTPQSGPEAARGYRSRRDP